MSCIFCRIIDGEIPSEFLYEDADFVVFRDIEPKATRHYLAVPRRHFASFSEMSEDDSACMGRILKKVPELLEILGLQNGYRLIINQGADAGQTVGHLHIHLMGGQVLDFPDMRSIYENIGT